MSSLYGKVTTGRDFNYFKKITTIYSSFADECDVIITFPTETLTFNLFGSGVVEYSFNGNTVHGEMDSSNSSKDLKFENRRVSKIWFRLISGTPTIRVEAWSNPV